MVEPYLNQIGGKVNNDVSMFTDGLNTYQDKAFLDANQMPYVMNMTMYMPPMLTTRPSRRTWAFNFNPQVPGNSNPVIDMFARSEDDIYLVVKSGTKYYLERYYKSSGVFNKQVVGEVPAADHYYFAYVILQTHRYIYIANESFKVRVDVAGTPGNPLTITTYNDGHYGIPCWHKQRLWLAKPSINAVEWSNAYKPDDFSIGYHDTPPTEGDSGELPITTMKGAIQNIVSFDDKLVILAEHSIHSVYGYHGVEGEQGYFQIVDINNNLGARSPRCVTVGGGKLLWLGDDYEVYSYNGVSTYMISRPGKTRNETISVGGISNIFASEDDVDVDQQAQMVATANKLYFNIGLRNNEFLFVFDFYNKTWWCEDGRFTAIAVYSSTQNRIIMAKPNGDILVGYERWCDGNDKVYDFEKNEIVSEPIKYEFHTRVFGADSADSRKTISGVWFQARASASVYINDIWTSHDKWREEFGYEILPPLIEENYKLIGNLKYLWQDPSPSQPTTSDIYRPDKYEQQTCQVEKMYGQRLNTFQIIVKGEGKSKFYLMKREWRDR